MSQHRTQIGRRLSFECAQAGRCLQDKHAYCVTPRDADLQSMQHIAGTHQVVICPCFAWTYEIRVNIQKPYTELKPNTLRPLSTISLPSWSRRVGPSGPPPVDSGKAGALMPLEIWAGPGAAACKRRELRGDRWPLLDGQPRLRLAAAAAACVPDAPTRCAPVLECLGKIQCHVVLQGSLVGDWQMHVGRLHLQLCICGRSICLNMAGMCGARC